jgi:hypothetical protein
VYLAKIGFNLGAPNLEIFQSVAAVSSYRRSKIQEMC